MEYRQQKPLGPSTQQIPLDGALRILNLYYFRGLAAQIFRVSKRPRIAVQLERISPSAFGVMRNPRLYISKYNTRTLTRDTYVTIIYQHLRCYHCNKQASTLHLSLTSLVMRDLCWCMSSCMDVVCAAFETDLISYWRWECPPPQVSISTTTCQSPPRGMNSHLWIISESPPHHTWQEKGVLTAHGVHRKDRRGGTHLLHVCS